MSLTTKHVRKHHPVMDATSKQNALSALKNELKDSSDYIRLMQDHNQEGTQYWLDAWIARREILSCISLLKA